MNNSWIVIPTYNEHDNIVPLIKQIRSLRIPNLQILIVDDNSPDRTADAVIRQKTNNSNLHLIKNQHRIGFARSYCLGFTHALQANAEFIIQMDADLSHNPADIPRLLTTLANHDLIIGSRYFTGVSIINWPLKRLLVSLTANVFVRHATNLPFKDTTGGFRAWRRSALKKTNYDTISADGYGFLVAMLYRAWIQSARIVEIPIIFTERREGQSKMSKRIMLEAFFLVVKLRVTKW